MTTSVKVQAGSPNAAAEPEKNGKGRKCEESRIPVLSPTHFRRTGSLKLRNEIRTPRKSDGSSTPTQPLRRHRSLQGLTSPVLRRRVEANYEGEGDEDVDSERSFGSSCNSLCGHSPFAHNGTTYSARNMKYVFHCSGSTATDEYLTPTQRANRTIKRLRRMLADAQAELLEKDNEIGRLTKEIVELRLLKAGCGADENGSCAADEIDFTEAEPVFAKSGPRFMDVLLEERDGSSLADTNQADQSESVSRHVSDFKGTSIFARHCHHSPSLADSGNFEDMNNAQSLEKECERLRQSYDDMREKHNEKVEQLLNIIADSNDRYYELKPKYDMASLRIRELEKEIETAKATEPNRDELQKNFYLQLYAKQLNWESAVPSGGEENSLVEEAKKDDSEEAGDLLKNLLVTKKELENVKVMYRALLDASKLKAGNDAEVTLRFLKTAVFYLLTDATNWRDHLAAIESILGFSEDEKAKIEKAHPGWKY